MLSVRPIRERTRRSGETLEDDKQTRGLDGLEFLDPLLWH